MDLISRSFNWHKSFPLSCIWSPPEPTWSPRRHDGSVWLRRFPPVPSLLPLPHWSRNGLPYMGHNWTLYFQCPDNQGRLLLWQLARSAKLGVAETIPHSPPASASLFCYSIEGVVRRCPNLLAHFLTSLDKKTWYSAVFYGFLQGNNSSRTMCATRLRHSPTYWF